MEGSTGELLKDAEDLMIDTKKRLEFSSDPHTSFEIVEGDLTPTKNNLKEFEKIYCELREVYYKTQTGDSRKIYSSDEWLSTLCSRHWAPPAPSK